MALPTVAAVRQLIAKLENYIDESRIIPATRRFRTIVVLGLVSKAVTVSRAVCCLVEQGFPGEAFGLTRTLIDIYLTVRYISNNDAEERAERYAKFFAKNHEDWTKIIAKFYPANSISPTPEHQNYLQVAKEYKLPNEWTGLRGQTREMALEPDSFEFDGNGNPSQCEFDYEVIYKWTSHYVHSTISSVESHCTEPDEPFRIRARTHLDEGRGDDALFNVLVYVSKIVVRACRAMRDDQPEEILQEFHAAMKGFTR